MNTPAYTQGVKTALYNLQLKEAAIGGLFSRSAKYLEGLGQRLEKPLYAASARYLSPEKRKVFKDYTQGVAGKTLQEMALGAGLGGVLSGGLEAGFAEPEDRGRAAMHGLLTGAGSGALWGGVSGISRNLIHSATRRNLTQYAQARKFKQPVNKAKEVFDDRSWFANVKDLATGKGPLGRRGAGIAALGGTAGLALGDLYLPSKLDSLMSPKPQEPMPNPQTLPPPRIVTASHKRSEGMPAEIKGSTFGSLATNIGTRAAIRYKKFPAQKRLHPFLLEIAPLLLTTAGGSAGYIAGKKLKKFFKNDSHHSTSKKK